MHINTVGNRTPGAKSLCGIDVYIKGQLDAPNNTMLLQFYEEGDAPKDWGHTGFCVRCEELAPLAILADTELE